MERRTWRRKYINRMAKQYGLDKGRRLLRGTLLVALSLECLVIAREPMLDFTKNIQLVEKEESCQLEWISEKDGEKGLYSQRYGILFNKENWELQFYHIKEDIK